MFYNIYSIVPLNNNRMRVGKDNYTIYIESVLHKHKKGYQNMSFFFNDKIFGGKLTVMFLFF